MAMRRYVLCYSFLANNPSKIYVVRKQKPEWQMGMYNLIGGKVEEDEIDKERMAAKREFEEESGINIKNEDVIGLCGKIIGKDFFIKVYRLSIGKWSESYVPQPTSPTQEEVVIKRIQDLLDHPRLIDNLKVVIPLCHHGVKNWVLDYTKSENPEIRFEE